MIQSNYIPWKGYFDLIHLADEFILYDDVQFTKNDWRNRNLIKTQNGMQWLTIPVQHGSLSQRIRDTKVADNRWPKKHWNAISGSYARAPYFMEYREWFEELYLGCTEEHISQINYRFITAICGLLGIPTKISWSWDYNLSEGKTERLVDLCRQTGSNIYISGPAAREYIQEDLFREAGVELRWMDYSGYPEYRQLFGPFVHGVSVIDLILNEGPNAVKFMTSFQSEANGCC
ncbi:hypothetical protein EHM69_07525 [candidate division KSB1 bacterium]|nr:MAG: hypothetical protein EHM69_07525 [candidate division KSB1 bacterium]